jgi:hypothetical protein
MIYTMDTSIIYPQSSGRVILSGIKRRVIHWKSTDVSEEHVESMFEAAE